MIPRKKSKYQKLPLISAFNLQNSIGNNGTVCSLLLFQLTEGLQHISKIKFFRLHTRVEVLTRYWPCFWEPFPTKCWGATPPYSLNLQETLQTMAIFYSVQNFIHGIKLHSVSKFCNKNPILWSNIARSSNLASFLFGLTSFLDLAKSNSHKAHYDTHKNNIVYFTIKEKPTLINKGNKPPKAPFISIHSLFWLKHYQLNPLLPSVSPR